MSTSIGKNHHLPSFGPVMITVAVVSGPSLAGSEGLLMKTSNSSMPSNVVSSMICEAKSSLLWCQTMNQEQPLGSYSLNINERITPIICKLKNTHPKKGNSCSAMTLI